MPSRARRCARAARSRSPTEVSARRRRGSAEGGLSFGAISLRNCDTPRNAHPVCLNRANRDACDEKSRSRFSRFRMANSLYLLPNRAFTGSANGRRLCIPRSSLCSCETARRRLSRGHSRTHHELRTHQSKVKMATIIAQQLSAGYVPLPDPPRRRAGRPRRARTRPTFPSDRVLSPSHAWTACPPRAARRRARLG